MRILFLSAGNNIHTVRWVNMLSRRGYEVHLLYNSDHIPNTHIIDKNVVQYRLKHKGLFGYYLNSAEVRKLFKKINPDIINAHYASGYGTLARVSKLKPLILSVWGSDVYDFPYQSRINMMILKKNMKYAQRIASTSIVMAKQVEKIMNKNMDITVTPFGVDVYLFKPIDLPKEYFVFGIVKTLSENYGIKHVIKGFKILLDSLIAEKININPILEIYGKGEMELELKSLCKELGIAKSVYFKGYIPNTDVPKAINKMDVFCLGSYKESFGVAAIEAMACEVPVIATDTDGFKEVIESGVTGYIIPQKDEVAMASKMQELLMDRKKRVDMGKKGRKRVLELYNWEKNVEIMEELYRKVAKF